MKLDDLGISRRGKNVVLNHQQYQIEYNLGKGTWNYNDKTGKTIIKNGFTQISLTDGTILKTLNSGYREFHNEPVQTDEFGSFYTLKFTYETVDTNKQKHKSKKTSNSKQELVDNGPHTQDSDDAQQNTIKKNDGVGRESSIRIHTYLTCYADHPYILLKVGVENKGRTPICLSNITLIDISSQHGSLQLGSHPTQYNLLLKMPPISPNTSVRHKIYDGFSLDGEKTIQPCQDGILHDADSNKSFMFGFITSDKLWPRIQLGYQVSKRKSQQGLTAWSLYHDCEDIECQTGEEITSEIGYLDFSEDAHSTYKRYAERLAENQLNPAQEKSTNTSSQPNYQQHVFSGWSFTSNNINGKLGEKTINEQINAISKSHLLKQTSDNGMDYIHLESGWQSIPGNLTLNKDSFPGGMLPVVDQIHKSGFSAGICIDPFAIDSNTDLVQKYPEVCLRNKSGEKTKSTGEKPSDSKRKQPIEVHLPGRDSALAILDVSHPKSQKHVRKVFKQIIDEWKYDFIKVDLSSYTSGMMSIAQKAEWHENSLTSTELYRKAVCLLKEIVDSTDRDILLAGYNIIECASMGSFLLNYPLLRQKYVENSDSWHHQNGTKHRICRYTEYLNTPTTVWNQIFGDLCIDEPRPVNEAIVEMTAAALSGNSILCVNTPSSLSVHRAELMAKLFPLSGDGARSVDRYDEPFPRIWHLPIETSRESWDILGVFNWKDQQDDVHIDIESIGLQPEKTYHVHDFWMRQYVGVVSKNVTLINIAPRSAKLLCFREEQQTPQLLSTDIHYTQGSVEILSAGWDNHSQSYLIICQPLRQSVGSLFLHVPESFIPIGVSAFGGEYQYTWNKPIYQLTFHASESLIHASIQFAKTTGGSRKS